MKPALNADCHELRSLIRECEAANDKLLVAQAALRSKILSTRQHAEVPQGAGQDVLILLQKIDDRSVQSGNDFFRAHNRLSDLYRELGGPDQDVVTRPTGFATRSHETA